MGGKDDRMERAGNYVLGLLDDTERERAEHDLEIDPAFRDAVVEVAGRMGVFGRTAEAPRDPKAEWKSVAERIADLPHMKAKAPQPEPPQGGPPVTFGRRRSDRIPGGPVPTPPLSVDPAWRTQLPPAGGNIGLHAVPGRLSLAIACGLIVAFALGYVAGMTGALQPLLTAIGLH